MKYRVPTRYKETCRACLTEIEFKEEEIIKSGRHSYIECPHCGFRISLSVMDYPTSANYILFDSVKVCGYKEWDEK